MENKKSRLGQNFLIDEGVAKKIVATLNTQDFVYEIGPGQGVLTKYFLNRIVVCELDKKLCTILQTKYPGQIKIINQNFKKITSFDGVKYIIGNIPFYITKYVFKKLIALHGTYQCCVLVLQKEVVEKIFDEKMTKLKFVVQTYFICSYVADIKNTCFSPIPSVNAAILKLKPRNIRYNIKFIQFMKTIFVFSRKKISTIFKIMKLQLKCNFEKKRLEDLKFEEIDELYRLFISTKF